jgi:hypothetical protein
MSNQKSLFNKKTLACFGHPAHELRAFGWMGKLHPDILLLTDGSGFRHTSRLKLSRENCLAAGLLPSQLHFALTCPDRDIYDALLSFDTGFSKLDLIAWCRS